MNFTFDETKEILKRPAVDDAMRRIIGGQLEEVPTDLPTWRFADRDNLITPFRLLRACVHRAITEADDPATADAVADAVEDYAVAMQYGADGLRSYKEFIRCHVSQ